MGKHWGQKRLKEGGMEGEMSVWGKANRNGRCIEKLYGNLGLATQFQTYLEWMVEHRRSDGMGRNTSG